MARVQVGAWGSGSLTYEVSFVMYCKGSDFFQGALYVRWGGVSVLDEKYDNWCGVQSLWHFVSYGELCLQVDGEWGDFCYNDPCQGVLSYCSVVIMAVRTGFMSWVRPDIRMGVVSPMHAVRNSLMVDMVVRGSVWFSQVKLLLRKFFG